MAGVVTSPHDRGTCCCSLPPGHCTTSFSAVLLLLRTSTILCCHHRHQQSTPHNAPLTPATQTHRRSSSTLEPGQSAFNGAAWHSDRFAPLAAHPCGLTPWVVHVLAMRPLMMIVVAPRRTHVCMGMSWEPLRVSRVSPTSPQGSDATTSTHQPRRHCTSAPPGPARACLEQATEPVDRQRGAWPPGGLQGDIQALYVAAMDHGAGGELPLQHGLRV